MVFERFSERARLAVHRSQDLARLAGRSEIDTTDLLLGALGDEHVANTLAKKGIVQAPIQKERIEAGTPRHLPFSNAAQHAIDLTVAETSGVVQLEHLLLGIERMAGGGASVLHKQGLGRDELLALFFPEKLAVSLRLMTEEEFLGFKERQVKAVVAQLARTYPELAAEERESYYLKRFEELLPKGRATARHHLWIAENEKDERVGDLWMEEGLYALLGVGQIHYVGVDEEYRDKPYRGPLVKAAEEEARALGLRHLDLFWFGEDPVTMRDYVGSLGYRTVFTHVRKDL
jgi:GNAT superfamily N-acetyltransferase